MIPRSKEARRLGVSSEAADAQARKGADLGLVGTAPPTQLSGVRQLNDRNTPLRPPTDVKPLLHPNAPPTPRRENLELKSTPFTGMVGNAPAKPSTKRATVSAAQPRQPTTTFPQARRTFVDPLAASTGPTTARNPTHARTPSLEALLSRLSTSAGATTSPPSTASTPPAASVQRPVKPVPSVAPSPSASTVAVGTSMRRVSSVPMFNGGGAPERAGCAAANLPAAVSRTAPVIGSSKFSAAPAIASTSSAGYDKSRRRSVSLMVAGIPKDLSGAEPKEDVPAAPVQAEAVVERRVVERTVERTVKEAKEKRRARGPVEAVLGRGQVERRAEAVVVERRVEATVRESKEKTTARQLAPPRFAAARPRSAVERGGNAKLLIQANAHSGAVRTGRKTGQDQDAPVPSSSAEPVVKGPVAAVRGPASEDIGQWDGNLDASIGCLTGYLARVIDDPEAALAQLKE